MSFIVVQRGSWQGVEHDILLESETAAAFLTAARDYMVQTKRAMPEIAEPEGGLRTTAETTEMRWAFDYGPHGMYANTATAAQRAQSDAWYLKYNMSRVSTARPAISGTHTTGRFFDVATAAFLTWLLAGNGPRYGITRPLLNDPNHCEFTPGTATAALDVTGLANAPTPPPEEDPMFKYLSNGSSDPKIVRYVLVSPFLPNGALVTADVKVARGMSALTAPAGSVQLAPTVVSDIDLDQAIAIARVNVYVPGTGGTVTTNNADVVKGLSDLGAKIDTDLAALGTKVDALPAKIDAYADGKVQS